MNSFDASRRRVLRSGLGLAAGFAGVTTAGRPAAAEGVADAPPRITFLDRAAAADALAHGDDYYAGLGLLEIRARMQSALPALPLADARIAVRDFDAAATLPFTDEERTAIAGMAGRLQPLLATRAPLYARTPWSFIQLDDRAEGGMPHTRGPHVVLPRAVVAWYVKLHRDASAAGNPASAMRGSNLLVHEQTHVLERLHPARFEPLFTQVFGFTRMTPAPAHAWLAAHRCINPTGRTWPGRSRSRRSAAAAG